MEKRGQGEGARTIERTESHRKEAEDDDRDELIAGMTAGQYLASRAPTLRPAMAPLANPFKTLALLNRQQWLFFLVGFLAWALDAMDFFTVSLTITNLAKEFHRKNSDITWGVSFLSRATPRPRLEARGSSREGRLTMQITLVLMLRSVGAIIFGIASDRYGRKWPFVVNNVLFIVLEIATGFCSSFKSFLVIRALFGIAMGGLYGNAAATALEDCPAAARGLVSGLYQQGYAFGTCFSLSLSRHWR